MTPEVIRQLERALPLLEDWIDQYLAAHASQAVPVSEFGFSRLPCYFSRELLAHSKAVALSHVELPPLSSMGLGLFHEFEKSEYVGITYKDTFFLAPQAHGSESTHFHELIHVIQWEVLQPQLFLAVYATSLFLHGYHQSPLERMAYELQAEFDRNLVIPDLEEKVRTRTRFLVQALDAEVKGTDLEMLHKNLTRPDGI